ncbi:Hsp20/alpha crystallin family protein [Nonomuraea rhodomycinica]|uniref:Hsp20/alpha crystallin family protein n=1 Tax=Nonomuraea rhodomycinica TaxID=1712872 RepID=A0A7Y6IJT4_9ACTN|nr:Hsp20/alpha crystallin family protein [Nonomuraea rhodomycinica]NUW39476.1 Hsp20/alpha crystallin family protein [Nonomuraea rhodomycinica]
MGTPARREHRGLFPDLFDWLEWPPGVHAQQMVRFEDYVKDGRYTVRAELPGLDPEKDVEITLRNGVLTIHGERREELKEQHRTEFRYGSFSRSITLPTGADEQDVKAVYDKGILEISVKLAEERREGRRIQVETGR